ncbi:hypothetical protein HPB50_001952 [Hyalomma asiaticum]|uniref:Uncharacterized protein n=1 Tax=Hyalomma asiaticum TaxID=266040 RepID=A0ACB7RM50_HYAAI|nr:hypothetical protein HPB50_001952 [Hyalomma asiaticum]
MKAECERAAIDDLVLANFENNITKRDKRYEVALSWKEGVHLGDNYGFAIKRLHSLMKNLSKDPELLQRYGEAVRVYFEEGSAERVPSTEENSLGPLYCMPHRAVLREDRVSTKVH